MSSHVPSPTSSPASGSQDASFRSSQGSNPDSSTLSLESSFQLDPSYTTPGQAEKHPKGKRKRTTTQDKAILEAAYNANPKPDKTARLELVKRVSLNEKEVQIWFQNRRQNDRRKSRPLSPQEIAALRYGGGMHVMGAEPSSFRASVGIDAVDQTRLGSLDRRSPTPQDPPRLIPGKDTSVAELSEQDRRHSISNTPPSAPPSVSGEVASEPRMSQQSFNGPIGYLSNRWNTGTSFSTPPGLERPGDEPLRLEIFTGSAPSPANSSPVSVLPPPSSSASQFRLSLSLEGKAELVSSLQSPPRIVQAQMPIEAATLPPVRAPAPRVLHRSRSALPGITLPPISALTANLPPQLTRGRSRDVQAWELCCEADTRDELTKLAENESSGSAIAAISLIRSSSQTSLNSMVNCHASGSLLRPNSSKRNAPPARRESIKKPKLSRSHSSVGRLQSLPPASAPPSQAEEVTTPTVEDHRESNVSEKNNPSKGISGKASSLIMSPGGDSDKENWSPDDEGNPITRRRPLPAFGASQHQTKMLSQAAVSATNPRRVGTRGVLAESHANGRRQPLGNRSNTAPVPRLRGGKAGLLAGPVSIFEDDDASGEKRRGENNRVMLRSPSRRDDDEVERFMRGEVSPSKKGDVDCVAGLLALSQGNWR